MDTSTDLDAYPGITSTELLELVTGELSVALELLTNFQLHEPSCDDTIEDGRPGEADDVRVAIRMGVTGNFGSRLGYLLIPLPDALVLAGSLLMLPTATLAQLAKKDQPDQSEKDALMEVGYLVAGSLDALLSRRFNGRVEVRFAGCQGVEPGEAPWVPGYSGEEFAVRRQMVSFGSLEPFELTVAIPV